MASKSSSRREVPRISSTYRAFKLQRKISCVLGELRCLARLVIARPVVVEARLGVVFPSLALQHCEPEPGLFVNADSVHVDLAELH